MIIITLLLTNKQQKHRADGSIDHRPPQRKIPTQPTLVCRAKQRKLSPNEKQHATKK